MYIDLADKLRKLQQHALHLCNLKREAADNWHPSAKGHMAHLNHSLQSIMDARSAVCKEAGERDCEKFHVRSERNYRKLQSALLEMQFRDSGFCLKTLFVDSSSIDAPCPVSHQSGVQVIELDPTGGSSLTPDPHSSDSFVNDVSAQPNHPSDPAGHQVILLLYDLMGHPPETLTAPALLDPLDRSHQDSLPGPSHHAHPHPIPDGGAISIQQHHDRVPHHDPLSRLHPDSKFQDPSRGAVDHLPDPGDLPNPLPVCQLNEQDSSQALPPNHPLCGPGHRVNPALGHPDPSPDFQGHIPDHLPESLPDSPHHPSGPAQSLPSRPQPEPDLRCLLSDPGHHPQDPIQDHLGRHPGHRHSANDSTPDSPSPPTLDLQDFLLKLLDRSRQDEPEPLPDPIGHPLEDLSTQQDPLVEPMPDPPDSQPDPQDCPPHPAQDHPDHAPGIQCLILDPPPAPPDRASDLSLDLPSHLDWLLDHLPIIHPAHHPPDWPGRPQPDQSSEHFSDPPSALFPFADLFSGSCTDMGNGDNSPDRTCVSRTTSEPMVDRTRVSTTTCDPIDPAHHPAFSR